MVDNTLKVLVVDCDIIHIHCRDVEAANCQQTSTVTYLPPHTAKNETADYNHDINDNNDDDDDDSDAFQLMMSWVRAGQLTLPTCINI